MRYIKDKYNNELSSLGYGCMRFPNDKTKTEELIVKAVEEGINYFDTAYIYPGSEKTLGSILNKNNLRDKVYIATKLPLILLKKKEDIDKYFTEQLKRLQTDHIDYYLLHMLTDMKMWKLLQSYGIEDWIKEKKKTGEIKQIGFSFHGTSSEFIKLLDAYDFDFCQIQYNYIDEYTQAGKKGLDEAYKKGMLIIIMEPLLGGVLANRLPKDALEIFKKYDKDKTAASWAFKWLYNQKEVGVVLSGMSKLSDLENNLETVNNSKINTLTKEEVILYEDVKKSIRNSYKINCTGCAYCMPCPFGVNIPVCFQGYNAYYSAGKYEGFKYYLTNTGGTSKMEAYASLCKQCGKCEKHCPQKIEIIKELKKVSKTMEPFWFESILKLVRKFLGINKTVENKNKK